MNWKTIETAITGATQTDFHVQKATAVGGGSINSAYRLQGVNGAYFVKLNKRALLPMFEAELAGLKEMAACRSVRVPEGIFCGTTAEHAYLVLEYIELGSGSRESERVLGQQLARMHQVQQSFFGWHRDNTIGSTPQINNRNDNWVDFWVKQRLGYQLQLAEQQGYSGNLQRLGENMLTEVHVFFETYQPAPSLLHGDLWGGNAAVDKQGLPFIFDPACYYGDGEADMAMTELFGGFGADFYAAYNEISPLDPGYTVRKNLYNLYHILNHLNLFGGGYQSQAENMMQRLLAEIA